MDVGLAIAPLGDKALRQRPASSDQPAASATEPVIYEIVKQFSVVPNIRRASIQEHTGWMVLELAGV